MKRKPSRLALELVETAEDMHRLGILDRATYEKITMRHLGPQAGQLSRRSYEQSV